MFRNTINSIASGSRVKEHAALVAAHQQDARDAEAEALKIRQDIARDDERCAQLRASLDEVLAHRYRLQLEVASLSTAHDRRRTERERQLRESADPRIEQFIEWARTQHDGLSREIKIYDVRGGRDPRTGRPIIGTSSNHAAVQMVGQALIDARRKAEALIYTTVRDVGAALEDIRRSVPTVDQAEDALRASEVA
jgi:hypothetical protein